MIDNGANRENMIAKVFGGAEVIQASSSMFRIGQKNVELACQTLEREGIKVTGKSTGSKSGRRILFRTYTGEVLMKYVKRQQVEHQQNTSKT
jgi:chemotaxis protein CheD